jgi:O-acetyl-ADP-ribose deacetylase (regulator of RNase III)
LLEECKTIGGCPVGEARITGAYGIKTAKWIIHTVGPRIDDDSVTKEDKKDLRNCYWNSLNLAKEKEAKSIVTFKDNLHD